MAQSSRKRAIDCTAETTRAYWEARDDRMVRCIIVLGLCANVLFRVVIRSWGCAAIDLRQLIAQTAAFPLACNTASAKLISAINCTRSRPRRAL